jgi:hypothetical protein
VGRGPPGARGGLPDAGGGRGLGGPEHLPRLRGVPAAPRPGPRRGGGGGAHGAAPEKAPSRTRTTRPACCCRRSASRTTTPRRRSSCSTASATTRKQDPVYLSTYGFVLMNAGRDEEAVTALRKAVAADPEDPDVHYWLGQALESVRTTSRRPASRCSRCWSSTRPTTTRPRARAADRRDRGGPARPVRGRARGAAGAGAEAAGQRADHGAGAADGQAGGVRCRSAQRGDLRRPPADRRRRRSPRRAS